MWPCPLLHRAGDQWRRQSIEKSHRLVAAAIGPAEVRLERRARCSAVCGHFSRHLPSSLPTEFNASNAKPFLQYKLGASPPGRVYPICGSNLKIRYGCSWRSAGLCVSLLRQISPMLLLARASAREKENGHAHGDGRKPGQADAAVAG